MQTLCKPSRRVYDTKAIEACHDDGTDEHSNFHLGAAIAIGGAIALAPAPVKAVARVAIGASAAAAAYLAEAEEAIAHTAEEVWDSITTSTPGTGGGPRPPSGSNNGGYGYNDPYADDHNNAQSGSH